MSGGLTGKSAKEILNFLNYSCGGGVKVWYIDGNREDIPSFSGGQNQTKRAAQRKQGNSRSGSFSKVLEKIHGEKERSEEL